VQLATPAEVSRFFVPLDGGRLEVRPEVRELVELRHHNLVSDAPPCEHSTSCCAATSPSTSARETTRA
jgi:chemotaxis methyl-accepting protein methylase